VAKHRGTAGGVGHGHDSDDEQGPGFRKYDPAQFIIPGQDTRGHSERLYCRVMPAVDRALDVVVNSKKWPFRTKGDVMRWAIDRAIHQLEAMEPIGSVTAQVDAIAAILREDQFHHEFSHTFEALNRSISVHLTAGADGEARRLVATIKDKIDKMPEGYWRDRYRTTLSEKWGHLLKGGGRGMGVMRFDPAATGTDDE
jgi:hypothetical protein